MFRSSVYAALYLDSASIGHPDELAGKLKESLLKAYIRVIRYFMAASAFLDQGKFRHAVGSLVPKRTVEQSLEDVLSSQREVEQWQGTLQGRSTELANSQTKAMLDVLQTLEQPLRMGLTQLDSITAHHNAAAREEFLRWISNLDYTARFEEVIASRMEGTALWIREKESFVNWRQSKVSCMLWLYGIMGSGKSVVTAAVVESLQSQDIDFGKAQTAYFFCDRTSREEQLERSTTIFRSILRQLLDLSSARGPEYLHNMHRGHRANRTPKDSDYLAAIVEVISGYTDTVVVIVDALDECVPEVRTALLEGFRYLLAQCSQCLKVFLSSRRERDIMAFVEKLPAASTFSFAMDNHGDISRFLTGQVNHDFEIDRFPAYYQPIKEKMVEGLLEKSQGMFRWAQMSLQSLYRKKGTPESALSQLAALPADLKELYRQIYSSIQELDEFILVKNALVFILYSRIPLSSTELVQAVFGPTHSSLTDQDKRVILLDMCSHFVEWDEKIDEIRLAHASVRDFLEHNPDYGSHRGHMTIARTCIDFLQRYEAERRGPSRKLWSIGDFVSYALTQWPYHLFFAAKLGEPDDTLLDSLASILYVDPSILPYLPARDARHLVYYGLYGYQPMEVPDDKTMKAVRDKYGRRSERQSTFSLWVRRVITTISSLGPLALHSQNVSRESFGLCDSPVDMGTPSPASSMESLAASLQSIASEAEVSFRDMLARCSSRPANPLFAFSVWRIPELLSDGMPIEQGAWLVQNEKGSRPSQDFCSSVSIARFERLLWQTEPLARKAFLGSDAHIIRTVIIRNVWEADKVVLLRKMLAEGASLENDTALGRSSLHCAADFNLADVIDLLLEYGAVVNAVDHDNATPLHRAAVLGCVKATQRLMEAGANQTLRDAKGRTPIFLAAEHAQWSVVAALAESHPDLNQHDSTGRTVLHHAASAGKTALVEQLVSRWADINAAVAAPKVSETSASSIPVSAASRRAKRKGWAKPGLTALHIALMLFKDDSLCRTLCDLNANVNAKDCDSDTPLHIAARLSRTEAGLHLLEKGADFNSLNAKEESVLLLAAHSADTELVSALVRRGANPLICDKHGRNALHYAAMGNHGVTFTLFRSLLGFCGATGHIDVPDEQGRTVLHYAVTARWKGAFIATLLDVGARLDARDSNGRTSAQLAREDNQVRLADYLDMRANSKSPDNWYDLPTGPADYRSRPPSIASSIGGYDSDTEKAIAEEAETRQRLDRKGKIRVRRLSGPGDFASLQEGMEGLSTEDYISWRLPDEDGPDEFLPLTLRRANERPAPSLSELFPR